MKEKTDQYELKTPIKTINVFYKKIAEMNKHDYADNSIVQKRLADQIKKEQEYFSQKIAQYPDYVQNFFKELTMQEIEDDHFLSQKYGKDNYEIVKTIKKSYEDMIKKQLILVYPHVHEDTTKSVLSNISDHDNFSHILLFSSLAVGISTYLLLKKIDEAGYFHVIKNFLKNIHLYFMGEKVNRFVEDDLLKEITHVDIGNFTIGLKNKTFDLFREKGLLDWFDSVLHLVDLFYKKKNIIIPKELDRVVMLTGNSGNGKITLVEAFFKDLKTVIEKYGDDDSRIEFLPS